MATESPDRRAFFSTMVYGLWGVIAAALSIPAALYLLLPPKLRGDAEWSDAGDIAKLVPDEPVELVFRRTRVDGWRIQSEKTTTWAVKFDNGQIVAFAPQCTHLGCAYHWNEAKKNFLCPCHTSVFAMDGKVLSGPAPRPLDRYESKIENNKLMVGEIRESTEQAG